MSDVTRQLQRCGTLAFLASAAMSTPALATDHLVISEVCTVPLAGQFIEIYNPLSVEVDLSNYYIADNPLYARLASFDIIAANGDFIAKFPNGTTIGPGARRVIAFSTDFATHYGGQPDFEFPQGKGGPDGPAPNMFMYFSPAGAALVIQGEGVTLFYWNGLSDLVSDVDIIRVGQPDAGNDLVSKTGISVDGPDPDTDFSTYLHEAITMGTMSILAQNIAPYRSYKRLYLEGLTESACAGNGITGHQELTENIAVTWDGNVGPLTAPTPGLSETLDPPPNQCYADIDGNGDVGVADLLSVIGSWGACQNCASCPADVAPSTCHDCAVGVPDLLAVISLWGDCH